MSEVALYNALERLIKAAEGNDYNRVRVQSLNEEFSRLLRQEFGHLPNWSMDARVLMCDRCANSAVYAVTQQPVREEHIQRMRERFSAIPKPK